MDNKFNRQANGFGADSRLGMGTLVDDSWDCWENKDYDTNPSGSTL